MKVLLAQKILGLAGSEIYLLNLVPGLRDKGIDAHFALFCDDEEADVTKKFKSRLEAHNVPVHVFNLSKAPSVSQLKKINRLLVNENYDIIHTHLLLADMAFALIKTFFNKSIKIVSTKHGYTEKYNDRNGFKVVFNFFEPYRIISQVVEKKITRSFAVSKALKDLYTGLKICNPANIDVIYHGFDYQDVEAKDSFRYSPKQIVIVGRLTAFKGHRFIIRAMKFVIAKHPDAKLIIVGDGPLKGELVKMVNDLSLHEHIIFTGFQPKPREVVASSDVVTLPSVAEAFGLVILEAMATNKPIVAFSVPTPVEIMEHERTALLTDPYNIEQLAQNVCLLLENKALASTIAKNAYILQKEKFDLQTMVSNTIEFYKAVK